VNFLLGKLLEEAKRWGAYLPTSLNTAYCNTIPPEREEKSPGDRDIEHKIRSVIRWNAVAIILRANKENPWVWLLTVRRRVHRFAAGEEEVMRVVAK
jgi:pyruvate dehydrogenase complex dehydrogenase (E1) component